MYGLLNEKSDLYFPHDYSVLEALLGKRQFAKASHQGNLLRTQATKHLILSILTVLLTSVNYLVIFAYTSCVLLLVWSMRATTFLTISSLRAAFKVTLLNEFKEKRTAVSLL